MKGRVSIQSRRVGLLEVELDQLLVFPGLPGFPEARRFAVVDHDSGGAFAWLVSMDDPDLAFVIANPWDFFPGYDPPVQVEHLGNIGVEGPEDLEIVVIASFVDHKAQLNLAAPLLINRAKRRGAQVILDDSRYTTREPIPEPIESKAAEKEAPPAVQAPPAE